MRILCDARPVWASVFVLVSVAIVASGCTRTRYRLRADRDAYGAIAERSCDPRWCAPDYSIEMDPRSRYFDAYDPDHSPMPPDDPGSHQYMQCVDGIKGWKHWYRNGERMDLENPAWQQALVEYVELTEEGAVKLDIDSAVRLAYVHSPSHQNQLETLYLSALDVTAQRFLLDTQFFGGYDTNYVHQGGLSPARIAFDETLQRFVILPPVAGVESNLLGVGRPSAENPALQLQRRFATAGELLVGFANSFVFEFTGSNANLAASLANFSFIQPLLRGAGKDVALEQLTQEERTLLANLRAYGQYRQGFHTQVAIGELGVTGPQRDGTSTDLLSFSGEGGVGGYLGLLRRLQEIRNSEDNLSLQERTLARLEALLENDLIDLVQVGQFRQSVEGERSNLLLRRNELALDLDRFKTRTLGLPPDLAVELDDSLIRQFQLVPSDTTALQDAIVELQVRVGDVNELLDLTNSVAALQGRVGIPPDDAGGEPIRDLLTDIVELVEAVSRRIDDLPADLARIEEAGPAGEQALIQLVREKLRDGPLELEEQFDEAREKLETLLAEEREDAVAGENLVWLRDLLRVCQGCILVQTRARQIQGEPNQVLADAAALIDPARHLFVGARKDLARMDEVMSTREKTMTEQEKYEFRADRTELGNNLKRLDKKLAEAEAELAILENGLADRPRRDTARGLVSWVAKFLRLVEQLVLVPARARLETVEVDPIQLEPCDAFHIALANRLDFMNGRAALVDRWRAIQVSADALQSILNVTASGDLRTARNNPVSFRAPTGTLRLGLEFDAPFTRLLERNDYRESLIDYQQSRRGFIQSCDSLHLGLRELLRQIEQLRQNLEIQRRAVTIAIERVDQTQLLLDRPPPALQPGQPRQISETTAINLLGAQTALRNTQNAFLAVWLNYYAARMRLYRELGIMTLDPEGQWIEFPIPGSDQDAPPGGDDPGLEEIPVPPLPPTIPVGWFELAESLPENVPAAVGEPTPAAGSRSDNTSGAVATDFIESDH